MLFNWLFMKTSHLIPLRTPEHFPLKYSNIQCPVLHWTVNSLPGGTRLLYLYLQSPNTMLCTLKALRKQKFDEWIKLYAFLLFVLSKKNRRDFYKRHSDHCILAPVYYLHVEKWASHACTVWWMSTKCIYLCHHHPDQTPQWTSPPRNPSSSPGQYPTLFSNDNHDPDF